MNHTALVQISLGFLVVPPLFVCFCFFFDAKNKKNTFFSCLARTFGHWTEKNMNECIQEYSIGGNAR